MNQGKLDKKYKIYIFKFEDSKNAKEKNPAANLLYIGNFTNR